MRSFLYVIFFIFLFSACSNHSSNKISINKNKVVPSELQAKYQEVELVGFIHFTVNTFTDKEWGYGDENPSIFNPTQLDAEQWAKTAKEAGLTELILTAKHHDGFCLWPSEYTEHSIKNSPYKNGEGDIVREFVSACKKYDLKAGLYLSPWDRNHADYGKPEYITYYRNQLRELLTNYGKISEIWLDGANGGDGYYGGANEIRKIDRDTYYDWENTFSIIRELQPEALIFSDAGPDIHWIGNEHGFAGETFWSMMDPTKVTIGGADQDYLNTGDPKGTDWILGQCDVSIRPGWFYHQKEDTLVKSPQQLVDIYYKSVGRNAMLLLNIPPDRRGLLHETDVKNLLDFKAILDETFNTNLAADQTITATNSVKNKNFVASNMLDTNKTSFWIAQNNSQSAEITIQFNTPTEFDRILLQEPIRYGQRISKFTVGAEINGELKMIYEGTTIGNKRLLRFNPILSSKIIISIDEANNAPAISNIGVYKASIRE